MIVPRQNSAYGHARIFSIDFSPRKCVVDASGADFFIAVDCGGTTSSVAAATPSPRGEGRGLAREKQTVRHILNFPPWGRWLSEAKSDEVIPAAPHFYTFVLFFLLH